jgi:hypothetical protein
LYYRSQGYRYPQNVRVPINYSGNAFTNQTPDNDNNKSSDTEEYTSQEKVPIISNQGATDVSEENTDETDNALNSATATEEQSSAPASLLKGLSPASLFGNRIGSEELLIIALIFLLSDNGSEADIIWLLLILLFIK